MRRVHLQRPSIGELRLGVAARCFVEEVGVVPEGVRILGIGLDRALVKRSTIGIKTGYFSAIFHGNDTRLREDTGALFHQDKRPALNALPFRNR